ncbi:TonB-dependent receptor [Zhongshania sp.]|uniref:TonB-dependent receptor n=1 Tax=Zhongshania sp. TaxID=1971902 RepID=UPI00356395A4
MIKRNAGILITAACVVVLIGGRVQAQIIASDVTPKKRSNHALEEVIVTATKRDESIQDVSGAVTAVMGTDLQNNNIQEFQDLADLVPSMTVQDENSISIRGLSKTSAAGSSPVAMHVNGVFIDSRGEPFYDLANIEITRGPSGTVYGRNATGGAINVKWARPASEWGVGGNYRQSSLTEEQFQFYVNIPFFGEGDERLLGRMAGMKRRSDGRLDDLFTSNESDPYSVDDQFVRLYLSSMPSDSLQLSLRAVRFESMNGQGITYGSPSLLTRRGGELEKAGSPAPLPDDIQIVRSNPTSRLGDAYDKYTRLEADITWSLTDLPLLSDVDVVLIGGEQRRNFRTIIDIDGTEAAILEGSIDSNLDKRSNAELRFVSASEQAIDWLAGVFWYNSYLETDTNYNVSVYLTQDNLGLPTVPNNPSVLTGLAVEFIGAYREDESLATYASFDFDMNQLLGLSGVEITAGIRQNWDKPTLKNRQNIATISHVQNVPFSLELANDSNVVDGLAKFSATTGEIAARWFYDEDRLVYAKWGRGYRPGFAQRITDLNGNTTQKPVEAEHIDALELGWKGEYFDSQFLLNMSAYYYDYTNLQVTQVTGTAYIDENAASAIIKGLDLEMRWSPSAEFYMQASVGWLDSRYREFCGTDISAPREQADLGCTDDARGDFSGAYLQAAPKTSAAILASYTFSFEGYGTLTPQLKTSWRGEQYRRGYGNPEDLIEGYVSSDIRLTWASPLQTWKVDAFAENIENHTDVFFGSLSPIVVGAETPTLTYFSPLPPRVLGVSLEARF